MVIEADDCLLRGLIISGFRHGTEFFPRYNYWQIWNASAPDAIVLTRNRGSVIEYCYIGTNTSGTQGDANTGFGIRLINSRENTIRHCLISGNWTGGIGVMGIGSTNNKIQSNKIGTDYTGVRSYHVEGTIDIGNSNMGRPGGWDSSKLELMHKNLGNSHWIWVGNRVDKIFSGVPIIPDDTRGAITVWEGSGNLIEDNIIAGNNDGGIYIIGNSNRIFSNQIGMDSEDGDISMTNLAANLVSDGNHNEIGSAGKGNRIFGDSTGVTVRGDKNRILGNRVQSEREIPLILSNATDSQLGGSLTAEWNEWSGGSETTADIFDGEFNIIEGNTFDMDGISGIFIKNESNLVFGQDIGNTAGGETYFNGITVAHSETVLVQNNTVHSHGHNGILVGHNSKKVTIRKNTFYDNGRTDIDLVFDPDGEDAFHREVGDGTDHPPDFEDFDSGGNGKQNFPVLSPFDGAVTDGTTLRVKGTLRASSFFSQLFTIDFYRLSKTDPKTVYVDTRQLETNLTSNEFAYDLQHEFQPGDYIRMTATDSEGNTSELSLPYVVDGTGASDTDQVSDEIEDLAPNNGDGNNDGIQDSQQPDVASFQSPDGDINTIVASTTTTSSKQSFWNRATFLSEDLSILGLQSLPLFEPLTTKEVFFLFGVVHVELSVANIGSTAELSWILPNQELNDITSFWHENEEGSWQAFSSFTLFDNTLTVTVEDGGPMDLDGEANGVVVATLGPASALEPLPEMDFAITLQENTHTVSWPLPYLSTQLEFSLNLSADSWSPIDYFEAEPLNDRWQLTRPNRRDDRFPELLQSDNSTLGFYRLRYHKPNDPLVPYHSWLRNQLESEYGITGGKWITGATEEQAMKTVYVDPDVTRTDFAAEDQPFVWALNLKNVVVPPNNWNDFTFFRTQAPIANGDTLLLVVWVRGKDIGEGLPTIRHNFEITESPFTKIYSQQVVTSDEWTQYLIPMEATFDMPDTWYTLHMGFAVQEIEVGGVAIINYGNNYTIDQLPKLNVP